MKIFIQNHIYDHNEFHNMYKEDIVYTPNGVLYYKKKHWRKQHALKEKYFSLKHSGYEFMIEDNIYEYNETYTHIPYQHIMVTETYKKYNIDHNVDFVEHSYLNQISYYFEIKSIDQIESVVSFLSKK